MPVVMKRVDIAQNAHHALLKHIFHGMRVNAPVLEPKIKKLCITIDKDRPGIGAIARIAHAIQQAQVRMRMAQLVQCPPRAIARNVLTYLSED